ncbi:nitroreductase family protein [Clostridium sp.]|uniref:nitroreductase family protein n=1 Tax=Clostridium sp. TaxID=1506 RepID=UPI0025C05217|nr:nitroreductase family protein [Clostridium sp.]
MFVLLNASLSSMMFMLLAKDLGWDTCPMNYFKSDELSLALDIPENEMPVLMITMGKAESDSAKIRGFRKPARDFVKYY